MLQHKSGQYLRDKNKKLMQFADIILTCYWK